MLINTKLLTKTVLKPFVFDQNAKLTNTSLIIIGLIAGILRVHLRYPLNIPGHHGLEWMSLLLFGKLLSTNRQAATILSISAATGYILQSPLSSMQQNMTPVLVFLFSGWCIDFLINNFPNKEIKIWICALLGGMVFILKPILMYVPYILVEWKIGMFTKHPDYLPFVSHFLFGAAGSALGTFMALKMTEKADNSK